jgi:hypothetical protein
MSEARDKALVAVRDPEKEEWSAAMQLLTPKERLFVISMSQGNSLANAARAAGYGDADSDAAYYAKTGWRESHRDKIIAALVEISKLQVRAMAPDAIQALKEIVNTKSDPARLRAVSLILSRVDPEVTKIDATVTHKFDPIKVTLELLAGYKKNGWSREMLLTEFSPFELDHFEKLLAKDTPVDAEFTELPAPDEELQKLMGDDNDKN